MENKSKTFVKSIFRFSIASWLQAIISLISIPIITTIFSPDEFGKINLFILTYSVYSIVAGLSLDQSYFRFFKENDSSDSDEILLRNFWGLISVMFIGIITINSLTGKNLSCYLFGEFRPILIYVALPIMTILTTISLYMSTYFRMTENAFGYGLLSVLIVFSNKLSLVLAAFWKPTYTSGILLVTISLALVILGFKLLYPESFKLRYPVLKFSKLLPYLKYSIPLLPVALIAFLNTAVIRFLLKDYVSYSALGIFTAAATIAGILSIVQAGFTAYWTPFMYSNYTKENKLIKRIHSYISFAMIFLSLLIILFSNTIFSLLGDAYQSGKYIFAFLLVMPVTYTISETTCYGIYINKKTHLQLYCTLSSFITNILIGILLIPDLGILGASIANAAGGLIFFLSRTYFGQKEYSSVEKIARTILSILILIIASVLNYFITSNSNKVLGIISLMLVLCLLYKEIIANGFHMFKNIKFIQP